MTPAPFWMIYGLGQRAPTARHKTLDSAVTEAKRLARMNPEVGFFVLEATHHVVKRDVEVTFIDPGLAEIAPVHPDDIPF